MCQYMMSARRQPVSGFPLRLSTIQLKRCSLVQRYGGKGMMLTLSFCTLKSDSGVVVATGIRVKLITPRESDIIPPTISLNGHHMSLNWHPFTISSFAACQVPSHCHTWRTVCSSILSIESCSCALLVVYSLLLSTEHCQCGIPSMLLSLLCWKTCKTYSGDLDVSWKHSCR